MTRALLALALVLSAAAPCAAAELDYTPPAPPAAPDAAGLVLRLVALTALLLALCGGVLWFARRAARPADPKGAAGRLHHEGSLVLDRRSAVHIVRVDGQSVAVTTDATGLRSMVLLSEPFEAALEASGAQAPAREAA